MSYSSDNTLEFHSKDGDQIESITQIERSHQDRTALARPFYETLAWAGKRVCYQPPTSGVTYVLTINSTLGHDIVALNSFFGSQPNGIYNEAIHIYAIERSTRQHIAAKQHNSRIGYTDQNCVLEPPSNFHFLNNDPVDLPSLPLPGQFHAVILRHLDISNSKYPWELILHASLDMLTPEGIAVITTFNNTMETAPLRRFLLDPNYETLLHDQNPHALLCRELNAHLDAIVTVIRKSNDYQTPPAPAIPHSYTTGIVDEIIPRKVFAYPLNQRIA